MPLKFKVESRRECLNHNVALADDSMPDVIWEIQLSGDGYCYAGLSLKFFVSEQEARQYPIGAIYVLKAETPVY